MVDVSSLQTSFKGDIATPNQPAEHAKAIDRWAINARRNAQVVALVKDAEDVSLALKFAREHHLEIAIRGGGHSTSGASSTEGLVVDLSRHLNKVHVNASRKLAFVGGGALWETVDKATIEHGLATVAGTVNHTGVAGLTLGGGYGWLTGAYGLALDNLEHVTIVVADGSILTASTSEHPDLFWGIRGGGCNFGVVTEFVFRLHEQRPTVFAGTLVLIGEKLEAIVSATQKWQKNCTKDKAAMIQAFTLSPDGVPIVAVNLYFNGSEAEGKEEFKDFFALDPVMDLTKEMPYAELNGMMNFNTPHGHGRYFTGVFQFEPHYADCRTVLNKIVEIRSQKKLKTVDVLFEYISLDKMMYIPGESTAFRRSPGGNVLAMASWDEDENTPEVQQFASRSMRELTAIVANGQKEVAQSENLGYGNYYTPPEKELVPPETDVKLTKSKAENLFGDSYPKLQALKAKYDPNCIFSKWFAITPKA